VQVVKTSLYSATALLVSLTLIVISGCAPSTSGNVYSRHEAKSVQRARHGEVLYVREVAIEGGSTLGTIAGGVMGYALGSAVGGGSGSKIAKTGGAIAGSAAGGAAQRAAGTEIGLEITVEMDNGELITVVQKADEHFDVGDSVRVITRGDGTARVVQ
jgi:outer membrane lipoprotein SlyB